MNAKRMKYLQNWFLLRSNVTEASSFYNFRNNFSIFLHCQFGISSFWESVYLKEDTSVELKLSILPYCALMMTKLLLMALYIACDSNVYWPKSKSGKVVRLIFKQRVGKKLNPPRKLWQAAVDCSLVCDVTVYRVTVFAVRFETGCHSTWMQGRW